eukprot:scaffold149845_cov34-Prasinocladus_malaysianus.AAC.1
MASTILSYAGKARGALKRAATVVGGAVLAGGSVATFVSYSARKFYPRAVASLGAMLPACYAFGLLNVVHTLPYFVHIVHIRVVNRTMLALRVPISLQVSDVVKVLDAAGKDVRVKGLLATLPDTLGNSLGGLAQIQEVRTAVSQFRLNSVERSPSCIAYADSYGGTPALYLASAFQDIYMQPTGLVMCTGL